MEIKPVKVCYEHIGGKFGELLLLTFLKNNWLAKTDALSKHFYITETGKEEFVKMGIPLSAIRSETI